MKNEDYNQNHQRTVVKAKGRAANDRLDLSNRFVTLRHAQVTNMAIKPYRRFLMRRSEYFLSPPKPAQVVQPVILGGRAPPLI